MTGRTSAKVVTDRLEANPLPNASRMPTGPIPPMAAVTMPATVTTRSALMRNAKPTMTTATPMRTNMRDSLDRIVQQSQEPVRLCNTPFTNATRARIGA